MVISCPHIHYMRSKVISLASAIGLFRASIKNTVQDQFYITIQLCYQKSDALKDALKMSPDNSNQYYTITFPNMNRMLEAKVYCFEFRPKKPQIDQKLWTTFGIFSLWMVLDAVDIRTFFGVPVKSLGYYGSIKLCGRSVASKLSVRRQTTKLTQKWFVSKNAPPRKSSEGNFFGHSTWNCYALSILNMYVKEVSRTFLSALLTSAILVISELGSPNYIVKSAILIFWVFGWYFSWNLVVCFS